MTTRCLLLRDATGCSPSRTTCSHPFCHQESYGSKDSLKREMEDTCIGNSWSPQGRRRLFGTSSRSLARQSMENSPEAQPQTPMSGKKQPEYKVLNSNLEVSPSSETQQPIGVKSEREPSPVNLMKSPMMYTFDITGISSELQPIIQHRLEWSELATCSGVRLSWESRGALGTRPEWRLILRIPGPNGGAVTEVNNMLSSMNFGVISVLAICSDGWIVTQSQWKPKEVLSPYALLNSGLLQTLILEVGTRM